MPSRARTRSTNALNASCAAATVGISAQLMVSSGGTVGRVPASSQTNRSGLVLSGRSASTDRIVFGAQLIAEKHVNSAAAVTLSFLHGFPFFIDMLLMFLERSYGPIIGFGR